MTDQEARSGAAATGTNQTPRPSKGGSYVLEKDGSLTRKEYTRQPGEPPPADDDEEQAPALESDPSSQVRRPAKRR